MLVTLIVALLAGSQGFRTSRKGTTQAACPSFAHLYDGECYCNWGLCERNGQRDCPNEEGATNRFNPNCTDCVCVDAACPAGRLELVTGLCTCGWSEWCAKAGVFGGCAAMDALSPDCTDCECIYNEYACHSGTPDGSACRCDWGQVCKLEGEMDCPREGAPLAVNTFFPNCTECECVQSSCPGWSLDSSSGECRCEYDEFCAKGGVVGACPSIRDPWKQYNSDCEDCSCIPQKDYCPAMSYFSSYDKKCQCENDHVCAKGGVVGACPEMRFVDPNCEDCSCVSAKDMCPDNAEFDTWAETPASACSCDYEYVCAEDGVPAGGACEEYYFPAKDPKYSCLKQTDICDPAFTTYEYDRCKCDGDTKCTLDGKYMNCPGAFYEEFEYYSLNCTACECASMSELAPFSCPNGSEYRSPDGSGMCSCDMWDSFCSIDGVTKGCPDRQNNAEYYWADYDFHYSCEDCQCVPSRR